jgi:DNA-directed RNA polymerase subunit D
MDIKILEMTDTKARFVISNATPEIANSLRRCLIAEVPKMAIETVEFHLGQIQGGRRTTTRSSRAFLVYSMR